MDIRNIKQNPPTVEDGLFLESIYTLQKDLMEGYIGKIEKNLPMYPININSEQGQLVLKDFSARIIEEIAEGYESTSLALELYTPNISDSQSGRFDMLVNNLQNSNEEQADAFAFFVELMLYANIQPEDIYNFISQKFLHRSKEASVESFRLSDIFKLGSELLIDYRKPSHSLFSILTADSLLENGYKPEQVFSYIPGFTHNSQSQHELEDHMIWKVAYHLNIGRNFLKNKTWKQTQEFTDGIRYQAEVVTAFIYYCGYLNIMGFTPENFYVLFYKKHMVNKFRQNSGY